MVCKKYFTIREAATSSPSFAQWPGGDGDQAQVDHSHNWILFSLPSLPPPNRPKTRMNQQVNY